MRRVKVRFKDTYPDYESAVSVILDSFAITKGKVDEEHYRRKMNFLLRLVFSFEFFFILFKKKADKQSTLVSKEEA